MIRYKKGTALTGPQKALRTEIAEAFWAILYSRMPITITKPDYKYIIKPLAWTRWSQHNKRYFRVFLECERIETPLMDIRITCAGVSGEIKEDEDHIVLERDPVIGYKKKIQWPR